MPAGAIAAGGTHDRAATGYNASSSGSFVAGEGGWSSASGSYWRSLRNCSPQVGGPHGTPLLSLVAIPLAGISSSSLLHSGGGGRGGGSGSGGGDGGGGSGSNSRPSSQQLYRMAEAKEPIVLTLASFAVTKLAYVRLTKLFREAYITSTGIDVRFRLTFAGSGVQARAVIDGLPADLVALALALDIDKISEAGLIIPSWRSRYPNNAVVCETTVAFVVRPGNPKDVKSWEDLVRADVQVVMANPKTAGVARWIFLALWGHRMKRGDAVAIDYVSQVIQNVVVQPRDAREASDVFYKQKVGDVLLTYENEVILTNQVYGDKALPYTIPHDNIRIECPLSVVDKVVQSKGPAATHAADDFAKFLFTPDAQREFAKVGFRVNPKVCKSAAEQQVGLPHAKLWSVETELGGWTKAQSKFFDSGMILDTIQNKVAAQKMEQRKANMAASGKR